MTRQVVSPRQPRPAARWPWQRNLQTRIVLTYTLLFLMVISLLMVRVGQSIYQGQLDASKHSLEIAAFLASNALEDPLSGYEAEFERFATWEAEQRDKDRAASEKKEQDGLDEQGNTTCLLYTSRCV